MTTRDFSITIAVEDTEIAGTMITPATKLPGVLFVHGWGGSQQQYINRARKFAVLGCVCLAFDLRGHAQTKGQYETVTRDGNFKDVLAAYDVLADHPSVDSNAIAVIGSSYGGYMAALLSSERNVRWLALRAPALYRDEHWNTPKRQLHKGDDLVRYRSSVVERDANRALRACAKFTGDVLIIESELDAVIPAPVVTSYVEACVNAQSLTYRVLKNADHGLSDDASQHAYSNVLFSWWREMLSHFVHEQKEIAS